MGGAEAQCGATRAAANPLGASISSGETGAPHAVAVETMSSWETMTKTPSKPSHKKTRARGKAQRKTSTAATRQRNWKPIFLAALAERGNVSDAAKAAKINRDTANEHRKRDQAFAAQWVEALEAAADVLEKEAWRRAHDGVLEPVFGRDAGPNAGTVEVGQVRKYSDTLLIFLLKGARPDKYREKHEIVGKGGGPIKTARELSDDELAAIAAGVAGSGLAPAGSPGTAAPPARA